MFGAPARTSIEALVALSICGIVFIAAVIRTRARAGGDERAAAGRSPRSLVGIVVQALAYIPVGFGPVWPTLPPGSPLAIGEAAVAVALMMGTIALFVTSARAMGRNWSLVARTRDDHQLVTWGPFATVRHPIYVALFLWMLALALALGHWRGLILATPLYWIGTWLRIAEEERLLRAQFGAEYDAYAARVKRFVPGII